MKKLIIMVILISILLSACNISQLSFGKIEHVPNNVQEKVDSNLTLQLIDGGKNSYIIFHSSEDIEETVTEQEGKKVTIKLNTTNSRDDAEKQNTFYLTTDTEHNIVEILVNGESTPFDNVTGL